METRIPGANWTSQNGLQGLEGPTQHAPGSWKQVTKEMDSREVFCINNYIHYKVWGEIIYPFPNFNGDIEVWEWISNFIPNITGQVIIYPCWDQS